MKNLKELRGTCKRQEVAEYIGVSTSYYGMLENRSRSPSLRIAKKIAQFYGVPIESIDFGIEASGDNTKEITQISNECKQLVVN